MSSETTVDQRQFATFVVDGLLFGVAVLQVQEVIRPRRMTRVPLAPPVVGGLINLRGQIVTALDLRVRLALSKRDSDMHAMNVVVRTVHGTVSLLVDEISDVVTVDDMLLEAVPQTLPASIRELTTAVYKLKDRLLLILDAARTTDVSGMAV